MPQQQTFNMGQTRSTFANRLDYAVDVFFESEEKKRQFLITQLLGKKSKWPGKRIIGAKKNDPDAQEHLQAAASDAIDVLAAIDPTEHNEYLRWIVKQVAMAQFRANSADSELLRGALSAFHKLKKRWDGPKDIFHYKNWRDLEGDIRSLGEKDEVKSGREKLKDAKEGGHEILDVDINTTDGPMKYRVYEVTTPEAACAYGRGAQWCTTSSLYYDYSSQYSSPEKAAESVKDEWARRGSRSSSIKPWDSLDEVFSAIDAETQEGSFKLPNPHFPGALDTAKGYLKSGSLYIVFKDNKPYMQLTSTGSEVRGTDDAMLSDASPALAKVFYEWLKVHTPKPGLEKQLTSSINRAIEKMKKARTGRG